MTTCPFCKSDISNDATRCPHCTSFLGREQAQESSDKITYVVDRGLITFLKVAGTVFAMFLTVGLSFYLIDVRQMRKQIAEQDFADATFEATGKLYGEGSPERAVVVQSWAVVGIAAGRPTQAGK